MKPDEVQQVIEANIEKTVSVVYADGKTQELFVHTVDDEGFVCDITNEMSQPPSYAYWVRFTDVREARAAGSGWKQTDSPQLHAEDSTSWYRYRDTMSASTKLAQQNDNEEALRLLDDAIAMAISTRARRT